MANETQVAGLFARTAASPADAGRYRVLVTNAWGQVSSAEAVVTVLPAPPNPVVAGRELANGLGAAEGLSLLNVRSLPGDPLVFTALKANLPVGIYRLDGGTLRVGAGSELGALGTIQNLMGSSLSVAGGQARVAVRLRPPTGTQPGAVAAGVAGLDPVFISAKLDGRRVSADDVMAAREGRLVLRVNFEDGTRALYANVGPSAEAPLRLEFTRAGEST